ncbi:hypothetical protein [Flaviaesturariibacter terrae]
MKESWQERLKRFEATPPPQVWNRVEESLEQDPASVAERLQAYTAPPPAGLWDRIEQQLDAAVPAEESAPVVVMPRRRSTFYTYMAAAAVLIAVLVGTALLLNRKPNEVPVAVRTETPAAPVTEPTPAPLHSAEASAPGNDMASVPVTAPDEAAAARRGQVTATRSANPTGRSGFAAPVGVNRNVYASAHPGAGQAAAATASLDEDRYLVRSYNNGSTVRFSKKVSAVVDCAEHATGFTQSLCKVSIGAVQEKLASSVTTDFGGLIERLQDLEKTK